MCIVQHLRNELNLRAQEAQLASSQAERNLKSLRQLQSAAELYALYCCSFLCELFYAQTANRNRYKLTKVKCLSAAAVAIWENCQDVYRKRCPFYMYTVRGSASSATGWKLCRVRS